MWIGGLQRVSRALFPNPNVRFATVLHPTRHLNKSGHSDKIELTSKADIVEGRVTLLLPARSNRRHRP